MDEYPVFKPQIVPGCEKGSRDYLAHIRTQANFVQGSDNTIINDDTHNRYDCVAADMCRLMVIRIIKRHIALDDVVY